MILWRLLSWQYKARITNRDDQIAHLRTRIEDYERRLSGTPAEKTTEVAAAPSPVFVKNISFSQDGANGKPLLLSAFAAQHNERLRFAVEVSTRMFEKWDGPYRVQLGMFREVAKEDFIRLQVIHVGNNTRPDVNLFWGNPAENYPVYDKPVQARIVIVGVDGNEQFHNFLLIRKPEGGRQFEILTGEPFDWAARWAAKQ